MSEINLYLTGDANRTPAASAGVATARVRAALRTLVPHLHAGFDPATVAISSSLLKYGGVRAVTIVSGFAPDAEHARSVAEVLAGQITQWDGVAAFTMGDGEASLTLTWHPVDTVVIWGDLCPCSNGGGGHRVGFCLARARGLDFERESDEPLIEQAYGDAAPWVLRIDRLTRCVLGIAFDGGAFHGTPNQATDGDTVRTVLDLVGALRWLDEEWSARMGG
ncbi:hypothetical protein [Actinokineospora terrae]|uniref:Uncharacterized protein n=1 Tax=Actinokineospora terrae TaxID=155974 RepID=A0A1H9M9W0_9PSEU|nr:hypothetical protein [Actinokineospora terrae]SER19923.1 hypothetical protein SAMN04487818_10220 [Actinokineospora terrae]